MCNFWGYIFYKVWIYNNDFIKIQKAVYKMFTAAQKNDMEYRPKYNNKYTYSCTQLYCKKRYAVLYRIFKME